MGPGGGDQYATVRLTGSNIQATIRAIEEKWQTFTARQPFQYDFFTDSWTISIPQRWKQDGYLSCSRYLLFYCLSWFACLITYITNKRTREIGIRKTYGASIKVVLGLLSKEVIYLILISSLIAYPLAYFGAKYWLEGFATRVKIGPLIYITATLITLLIGWLAISYQTIKAAANNPANALRVEWQLCLRICDLWFVSRYFWPGITIGIRCIICVLRYMRLTLPWYV